MDYEVGSSIICDTQSQVERFVALFSGDTQAAIDAVNAEEQNPTACALVDVAYLRGAEIGMARNGDSAFEIVRILVVGIDTAAGIQARLTKEVECHVGQLAAYKRYAMFQDELPASATSELSTFDREACGAQTC